MTSICFADFRTVELNEEQKLQASDLGRLLAERGYTYRCGQFNMNEVALAEGYLTCKGNLELYVPYECASIVEPTLIGATDEAIKLTARFLSNSRDLFVIGAAQLGSRFHRLLGAALDAPANFIMVRNRDCCAVINVLVYMAKERGTKVVRIDAEYSTERILAEIDAALEGEI